MSAPLRRGRSALVAFVAAAGLLVAATMGLESATTGAAPVPWDYATVAPLAAVPGDSGPAPFVVDFDDDGDDDLLVGWRYASNQGGISVYLREADGSLAAPTPVL